MRSTASLHLTRWCAVVLARFALLAALPALLMPAQASEPDLPQMVHALGSNQLDLLLHQEQGLSVGWGLPLIVIGLVYVFAGLRLIRWSMAGICALGTATLVLLMTLQSLGPVGAWCCAGVAGVGAGIIGYFLYQMLIAVTGGALLAALLATLAAWAVPKVVVLALLALIVGAVIGLILGWLMAPYVAIFNTVWSGIWSLIVGVLILVRITDGHMAIMIAVAIAVLVGLPGIYVQVSDYRGRD